MRKLRAFTLLEVVIALAILAIGLVGILSLFPVGFQASRRASMLTEGTIHAQQKLEEIKTSGYDALATGTTAWAKFSDAEIWWRTTVTEIGPGGTGLKDVILEIKWQEKGEDKIEKFVTYIAKL